MKGVGGAEVGGAVKIYCGQYINYCVFITAVINFIIMAFVLFLLLKSVNTLLATSKKKKDNAPVPKSDEVLLLEEIRDLLKKENKTKK